MATYEGISYGLSALSMQAILLNNFSAFQERIKVIALSDDAPAVSQYKLY